MSSTNFVRLCEINNSTVVVIAFWSILHDCAKFSHDHEKSACTSSLAYSIISPSGPFRMTFLSFLLSFLSFFSFDSTSTPNPDPNQLHYFFHYAFRPLSTLFVLFNFIHLFCHKFIIIIP